MTRPARRSRTRCAGYAATVLLAAGLLVGCGSGADPTEPAVPEDTHQTPSAAPTPPADPTTGRCYRVDFDEALSPTAPDHESLRCGRRHTAETYHVGRLDLVAEGHLLAVDSAPVQDQVAAACPAKLPEFLGADLEALRLSMVQPVWFSPTLEQADAGAEWFRCDAVVVEQDRTLVTLTESLAGALGDDRADRLGMCGTAAPDAKNFERVACGRDHSWRAVAVVGFDTKKYPGAAAARERGQTQCEDVGADRAADPLNYEWGYEWPTKKQWRAGMTFGRCWVPDVE